MNVIKTRDFEKAFGVLPKDAQRLYRLQERRFFELDHRKDIYR